LKSLSSKITHYMAHCAAASGNQASAEELGYMTMCNKVQNRKDN